MINLLANLVILYLLADMLIKPLAVWGWTRLHGLIRPQA